MYLVFAGDNYYPLGGFHDFQGAFGDLDEAREFAEGMSFDWWHIVQGDEIVEEGRG